MLEVNEDQWNCYILCFLKSSTLLSISTYLYWLIYTDRSLFLLCICTIIQYSACQYVYVYFFLRVYQRQGKFSNGFSSSKKCLQMLIHWEHNLLFWPLCLHIVFQFIHNLRYFHMSWTHELSTTVVNHKIRTRCRVKAKLLGTQNVLFIHTVPCISRWWFWLNPLVEPGIQTMSNKTSALSSSSTTQ